MLLLSFLSFIFYLYKLGVTILISHNRYENSVNFPFPSLPLLKSYSFYLISSSTLNKYISIHLFNQYFLSFCSAQVTLLRVSKVIHIQMSFTVSWWWRGIFLLLHNRREMMRETSKTPWPLRGGGIDFQLEVGECSLHKWYLNWTLRSEKSLGMWRLGRAA